MITDSLTHTSRSAGGMFTYLCFGYLMLRNIVEAYEDGRRDELHSQENIAKHARRLMLESLDFAGEADAVLSGQLSCPCCGGADDGELGPRHPLYVHPAALVLYRLASTCQQAAAIAMRDDLDLDALQQVWLDEDVFAELLDDQETRRFLEQQTSEDEYVNALPDIYAHVGIAW